MTEVLPDESGEIRARLNRLLNRLLNVPELPMSDILLNIGRIAVGLYEAAETA